MPIDVEGIERDPRDSRYASHRYVLWVVFAYAIGSAAANCFYHDRAKDRLDRIEEHLGIQEEK